MRAWGLAIILAATGGVAQADGAWPFRAEGWVALGATDRIPGSAPFVAGDLLLSLGVGRTPLSFELGAYGYLNKTDTPHETYGALAWTFPGAKVSAGVVKPAYDSFAPSALDKILPTLGAERATMTRSEATWGAMFDGYLPLGARLDASLGPVDFAVSAHREKSRKVTIVAVGAAWSQGAWTFSGAVDGDLDHDTGTHAKLAALWTGARMTAGAAVFVPDSATLPDLFEVSGSYAVTPDFGLSGVVQVPLDGSASTLAVSGRYQLANGIGVNLGAGLEDGDDTAVSAYLDWRF
ncbi:hypothetical protein [Psychromarinibacter sp. S121]|uniref:hypothetical protein n=1 Tax=Psychromarinibacter sp. S121 TaxID=3415127 RepID=UPI003C7A0F97